MNIIELARQAGALLYTGRDYTNTQLTFSKQQLETFARLVIEAHVASVDMEPVGRIQVLDDGVVYFNSDPPTEYQKSLGWKPVYTVLLRQALEVLEDLRPVLDKAWDFDGDVFGRLHNDAADADQALNGTIKAIQEAIK